MPKITVTREIEVPDGEWCRKCEVRHWDFCPAFDRQLVFNWDEASYRKAHECLEACARAGE